MTEKAPEAFRTISEVAEELDLPQHVLRFWETRFSQIRPMKRGGGRRYYRPEDVDLLRGIRHILYGEGYTIKGAQRILKERGIRHVAAIGRGEDPDAVQEVRQALPTLKAASPDPLSEYAPKRVREQAAQTSIPAGPEPAPEPEEDEQEPDVPGLAWPDDAGDDDTPAEATAGPADDTDTSGGHDAAEVARASLDPAAERTLRKLLTELQDCRRILRDLREKART